MRGGDYKIGNTIFIEQTNTDGSISYKYTDDEGNSRSITKLEMNTMVNSETRRKLGKML
jgi:hypothetical protein